MLEDILGDLRGPLAVVVVAIVICVAIIYFRNSDNSRDVRIRIVQTCQHQPDIAACVAKLVNATNKLED